MYDLLLSLVFFWKPIFFAGMYFYKKDAMYLSNLRLWGSSLWSLISPIEIPKSNS